MEVETKITWVREKTTTESIAVGPQVEVRRITIVRTHGPHVQETTTRETKECVTFTGKVDDENFGFFVVATPKLLESMRMEGWMADGFEGEIAEKPFSYIQSGKPHVVVRLKTYNHTLFDVEGQHLPVGMRFSYLDGNVASNAFDLDGLLAHLKARNDVTLDFDTVQEIPYYNRDVDRTHHISGVWRPDVDVYRQFRAELGGNADSWRRYELAHKFMGNDNFRLAEVA